jgi:hypothetical protein
VEGNEGCERISFMSIHYQPSSLCSSRIASMSISLLISKACVGNVKRDKKYDDVDDLKGM